jgi:hypothetical protein
MINQEHIDDTFAELRPLLEKASERIEAIKDETYPVTKLAADVAKEYGMTGPQFYPVLLFLTKGYPGFEIIKGAKGGIRRFKAKPVVAAEVAVPANENSK